MNHLNPSHNKAMVANSKQLLDAIDAIDAINLAQHFIAETSE